MVFSLKKCFVSFGMIVILYIYIFSPHPFDFLSLYSLFPFALYSLFCKDCRKFLKNNLWLLKYLFLICLFSIFRWILGGDEIFVRSALVDIIFDYLVPVGILSFFKVRFQVTSIQKILIVVFLVASLISVFLIINPQYAIATRVIFDSTSIYTDDRFIARRQFGISQYLLFTYSILMAFMAGKFICINKMRFFIMGLLCVIAFAFNARTGFVILFIYILVYVYINKFNILKFKYFLLIPLILAIGIPFIAAKFPETYEWIIDAFVDVFRPGDSKEGTLETLNSYVFFPEDLQTWLIGEGFSRFHNMSKNSDVGYVNQIFYGGIIYFILLFRLYFKIIKRYYKLSADKIAFVGLIATILISNYKGFAFSSNELTRFILISMFALEILKYEKTEYKKIYME